MKRWQNIFKTSDVSIYVQLMHLYMINQRKLKGHAQLLSNKLII